MPSGRRFGVLSLLVLSLRAFAASPAPEPGAVGASTSRLAWALKPGVFERLSPGARQAVLVATGLAKAPAPGVLPRRPAPAADAALAAPGPRQNVKVNSPALVGELGETRTTSIAARGSRVFVGFGDSTYSAAGYGVSNDGGATFTHLRIAAPTDFGYYGSPSVAFGPSGEIYYAFLEAATGATTDIALAKSTDGGQTFPTIGYPAGDVVNGYDMVDQPAVAVDNGVSSPRKGTVYVVFTYYFAFYGDSITVCVRSTDGNVFQAPVVLANVGALVGHASGRRRPQRGRLRCLRGPAPDARRHLDHALDRRRRDIQPAPDRRDVPARRPPERRRRRCGVEPRVLRSRSTETAWSTSPGPRSRAAPRRTARTCSTRARRTTGRRSRRPRS